MLRGAASGTEPPSPGNSAGAFSVTLLCSPGRSPAPPRARSRGREGQGSAGATVAADPSHAAVPSRGRGLGGPSRPSRPGQAQQQEATHHDVRAGQREGLGADERRHHVEEQHEGHQAGGSQQQHLSARATTGRSRAPAARSVWVCGRGRRRGEGKRRSRGGAASAVGLAPGSAPPSVGTRLRRLRTRTVGPPPTSWEVCKRWLSDLRILFVPKSRDSTLRSQVPVRIFLAHLENGRGSLSLCASAGSCDD